MVQKICHDLAFLLGKKEHFRIRFRQYDGAESVFFPHYPDNNTVCNGDIVAFLWGDTIKFGISIEDSVGAMTVRLLPRRAKLSNVKCFVPTGRLVARFLPE